MYLFDVAAIGVTIVILLSYTFRKKISSRLSIGFVFFTLVVCFSNILDLITLIFYDKTEEVSLAFQYLINILYLLSYNGIAVVFTYCIILSNQKVSRLEVLKRWLLFIPYLFAIIAIITTPKTKAIFYFDENLEYCHGFLFYALFGIGFFYVFYLIIYFIKNKKELSTDLKVCFGFHTLATYSTLILQMKIENLYLIGFMTSITSLLLFLAIEDPSNYTDKEMEIFSYAAFIALLKTKFSQRRKFQILALEIEGLNNLEENIGRKNKTIVLKRVSGRLSSTCGKRSVFRISNNRIAIIFSDDNSKQSFMLKQVSDIFAEPYQINDTFINFSIIISFISCPEVAANVEDVLKMIDISLKKINKNPTSQRYTNVVYADAKFLEIKHRQDMILDLLKNTLANKKIAVYYQPIYSANAHKYVSAYATYFLVSKTQEKILPKEFVPIAIENGLIIELEELYLNQVCNDISEYKLFQTGIHSVILNLSHVFWQNEILCKKIIYAIDNYHLDSSSLQFSVNDEQELFNNSVFIENVRTLHEMQIKISLNDYGQNISNQQNLIKYDFDSINLNEELVYFAPESKLTYDLLKTTIKMLQELKKEVVLAGVEREEHLAILQELKCDFMRGSYYSDYLSVDSFMEFVR